MTMRATARGAFLAMVCLGMAGGVARAGSPRITRRDLAIRAARVAGVELPSNGEDRAAAAALMRGGIDLGADPKAPVTEATLVELGKAIGVTVSTSKPRSPVSRAFAAAFLQSIQVPLQSALTTHAGSATVNASCKGREARSVRQGVPASNADPNATAGPCEEPIP
ncbi:MAG TPA: hypothetical protein VGA64_05795 [Candidatus Polarisedimenticolia bacterium]